MERDYVIISRGVDRELHYDLTREVGKNKKHDAITVFLTTFGGDADAGYRIGRCLQHNYSRIRLVIPSYCKSAGTLIAVAANELAIGDLGELGPLDVQVRKHNEIMERSSGLDFMEAMDASLSHIVQSFRKSLLDIKHRTRISTKLAGEFAAQIASSIASPLYSQIDPNRVGEMQRAINIALGYGGRLAEKSKSIPLDALNRLVADYPSHGFVIDRSEARTLFQNVVSPSDLERSLIDKLWVFLKEETKTGPFFFNVADILKDETNEPEVAPADGAPIPDADGHPQDGAAGDGEQVEGQPGVGNDAA